VHKHKLISVLRKLVAAPIIEIPKEEYRAEIEKYFCKSPELIEQLNLEEEIYRHLGTEHCISTGNIMFRYRENELKKHLYIVGIVAKSGRIEPQDLLDIRNVSKQFVEKLLNGWVVIASVNSNSRRMIDRLKDSVFKLGKEVFEKSLGKSQWRETPDYKFDTIAIGINQAVLNNFRG